MHISLKKPPYIFTTKTVFRAGREVQLVVQVFGRPGDVGRVAPLNMLARKSLIAHNRYLSHFAKL